MKKSTGDFLPQREVARIENLNLIDDFMFTEASTDEQTAEILLRLVVERAAELKVEKMRIESQKVINGIDTDKHGIRIDVMVREIESDGKTVQLFDVEPNNIKSVNLPKRSRYYQALVDVKLLDTGVKYDELPDMWTIWILPYDPFGQDYMLYSVKNMIEKHQDIEYEDGIRKLFLYTGGTKGGTEQLGNLLRYIENSVEGNAVDEELKELHTNVERLKSRKEMGVKYMNLQEVMEYRIEEAVEAAVEAAVEENNNRMSMLMKCLLEEERLDELRKAAEDPQYREKIMKELGI